MTEREYRENNVREIETMLDVTNAFNKLIKSIESGMDIQFCDHYCNREKSFQVYKGIEYLAFILGADTRVDGREKKFEYNGYTFYQLCRFDEDGVKYWE